MLSWFIIHPCLFLSPPILIFLLVSWLEITEYTDNSQIYIRAQSLSQCSDVGWSAYVTRFVVLPIISNWPCWKVESSKSPLHAASPSQGWQTTHRLIHSSGDLGPRVLPRSPCITWKWLWAKEGPRDLSLQHTTSEGDFQHPTFGG